MLQEVDVSAARRKAMGAYMADGLWEIFLGFYLTLIGTLKLLAHYGGGEEFNPSFVAVMVVLFVIVIPRVKAKLTFPRIGYVNVKKFPGNSRYVMMGIGLAIGVSMVVLAFLLNRGGEDSAATETFNRYVGLGFAVLVAAVISTIAFIRQVPRMHIASVFFILVFATIHILHVYTGYGFLITGAGLLIAGIFILIHFIRTNPVLPDDPASTGETGGR